MKSGDPDQRPPLTVFSAVLWILLGISFVPQTLASTISDLVIVMESDGKHYTAQHTLYTLDELSVVTLPPGRTQQHVEFGGPNSSVFARAHEKNPDRLSLWSGAVFSRFRHQFADDTDEPADESAELSGILRGSLDGFELTMANTEKLSYTVTWVLPDNAELVSLSPDMTSASSVQGQWDRDANLVTFRQYGGPPSEVSIDFRLATLVEQRPDDCVDSFIASDECSPDVDNDAVPDYRDICLPASTDANSTVDQRSTTRSNAAGNQILQRRADGTNAPSDTDFDVLGCANEGIIVLQAIEFESGKTYLSAKVRQVLDRIALAILRSGDSVYEIATHTDNAGRVDNNQRLSENRADAIRHYLMLRGVGPNQLRSRGYGETSPRHDNNLASGRAANRRVELRRIE